MARSNNNNKLKAYVRFDGSGRIVPSSLIVQAFKPKVGNWQEIDAKECCNSTTTTTTTVGCVATLWEYTITGTDVENSTGNTSEILTVNVPEPLEVTAYDAFAGEQQSNCPSGNTGGGVSFNSESIGTHTLCSVNEPYFWYYNNNEAIFLTMTNTSITC